MAGYLSTCLLAVWKDSSLRTADKNPIIGAKVRCDRNKALSVFLCGCLCLEIHPSPFGERIFVMEIQMSASEAVQLGLYHHRSNSKSSLVQLKRMIMVPISFHLHSFQNN